MSVGCPEMDALESAYAVLKDDNGIDFEVAAVSGMPPLPRNDAPFVDPNAGSTRTKYCEIDPPFKPVIILSSLSLATLSADATSLRSCQKLNS